MVSVVMSTYKEPISYVKQAIDSILNQTLKEIEFIIIIDEPSNKELIEYVRERQQRDNRIKLLINESNCGLVESLNRGIEKASGRFIARMDADDISEVDRLEVQLKYLIDNDLDLVGCNVINIDENGAVIDIRGTNYPTTDKVIKKYLKMNNAIPHSTWFAKTTVFGQNNRYHNFKACEDYEFLTRIALDGKRLGNVKVPKLKYRINSLGISNNNKVQQKIGLYYVKSEYTEGEKSSLENFHKFLESKKGKKKQEDLRNYYKSSEQVKKFYHDKEWVKFLISGISVFVNSETGRQNIFYMFREWMLRIQYGVYY